MGENLCVVVWCKSVEVCGWICGRFAGAFHQAKLFFAAVAAEREINDDKFS